MLLPLPQTQDSKGEMRIVLVFAWLLLVGGVCCVDYIKFAPNENEGSRMGEEALPILKTIDIGFVLIQRSCNISPSNLGRVFITSPVP